MPTLKPKPTKRLTGKAKDLLLKLPKEWQGIELILEIQSNQLVLRKTLADEALRRLIEAPKGLMTPKEIDREIQAYRRSRQRG